MHGITATTTAAGALAVLISLAIAAAPATNPAAAPRPAQGGTTFSLADFDPPADGKTDAGPALERLFTEVARSGGGTVVIPRGRYHLAMARAVPLPSNVHVTATGAEFTLGDPPAGRPHTVAFAGENVRDFTWVGGTFRGRVFDPASPDTTWVPHANTRVLLITTTPGGITADITVREVRSSGVAGAVISVFGASVPGSESDVRTHARNVTVADCTLEDSGKFMWDYGFLWQILTWPEEHTPTERTLAAKYFPAGLIRRGVTMADGDDRVRFDNGRDALPVAKSDQPRDVLTFFGGKLPANVGRGRQYFVVDSAADHVRIADRPGGEPIRFRGSSGEGAALVHDMFRAFHALYAPVGSGPGKGGVDIVAADGVRVTGCVLSARGDTMHIQRSRNIVFNANRITGSRMGAFFLAEFCSNAVVTGNTVDGTNGSRVMSVEKSCRDVTITGNTFRNGGRGSWINQPVNFVLAGNVFVDNTTKCTPDPRRGRRTYRTGGFETYAELYFTLHRPDGAYDSVIVRDNVFDTGPDCGAGISFAQAGSRITVTGNIFKGPGATVVVDPSCRDVTVAGNTGLRGK